jgi:hypothetical protein
VAFFFLFFMRAAGKTAGFFHVKVFLLLCLILLTKASSALMVLPVLVGYFLREAWKGRGIDYQYALACALPFLVVGGVLFIARVLHAGEYFVESNKMINVAAIANLKEYLNRSFAEFKSEFSSYLILFPIGLLFALRDRGLFGYFVPMTFGFFLFYLVMLRGALAHQYYLMPFLIPFGILSCHGFFRILSKVNHRNLRIFAAVFFLVLLGPSFSRLNASFASVYSEGVMDIVKMMKDKNDRSNTLVVGGACRIFQYYLSAPTAQIKCDEDGFMKHDKMAEYFRSHNVQFIITEEHGIKKHDQFSAFGYGYLCRSEHGRGAMRYVIYRKDDN